MIIKIQNFNFSGISVDSFENTENDSCYVTFGGFAEELGFSRQNLSDWLDRNDFKKQGIAVQVGIRKVHATAYPLNVVTDYFIYRLMVLQDMQILALFASTFHADLLISSKNAKVVSCDYVAQVQAA